LLQISVVNRQKRYCIDRAALRRLVRDVLREEGRDNAEIVLALVGDAEMADLHRRFLQVPGATDVLTFPWHEPQAEWLGGDIAVSVDTADREAKRRGHALHAELSLYVVHGLLHLCGYDDRRPADRRTMRARERHHLERAGLILKVDRKK